MSPTTLLPDLQKDLWSIDPDAFNHTFSNNVGSVYFSVAAFLPLLSAGNEKGNVAQSSQVIITGSIGAYGRVPLAHFAYSASKAAVTHMAVSNNGYSFLCPPKSPQFVLYTPFYFTRSSKRKCSS